MPISISRTGPIAVPEITQEQRDILWAQVLRAYIRENPELLTEKTITLQQSARLRTTAAER